MNILKDIKYFFRRVWQLGQTLRIWFPVLWNDRNFDWAYLLDILELKLRLMSKSMSDNDISTTSQKKAKEMLICAALCKRIRDDRYDEIPLQRFTEKYGTLEMNTEPTSRPNAKRVIMDWTKARNGTEAYENARKEGMRIHDEAELQQRRDIDYLFDTIKRRILGWWD